MENVTVIIPTFKCPNCPYTHQANYDPYEPGRMALEFPEFPGMADGACPACYSGRNPQRIALPSMLERVSAESDMTTTAASDAELESREVEEVDEHGNIVMEETDEVRYRFDTLTGQINPYPVMRPKMRSLTQSELTALKEQRDQSLDQLETIAVSEVTPEN